MVFILTTTIFLHKTLTVISWVTAHAPPVSSVEMELRQRSPINILHFIVFKTKVIFYKSVKFHRFVDKAEHHLSKKTRNTLFYYLRKVSSSLGLSFHLNVHFDVHSSVHFDVHFLPYAHLGLFGLSVQCDFKIQRAKDL